MDRPWTLKYNKDGSVIFNAKRMANLDKLKESAPEMAELLIEFYEEIAIRNDYSTFVKLSYRALELLKLFGYNPDSD